MPRNLSAKRRGRWRGDFALVGLEGGAQDIAYCPDARHLATVGSDGSAGIWNAASGELKHMIVAADKPLYAVACSPDSKHLAVAGVDGTVRIIETESGEMEFELPPAYREKRLVAILDVAFGPKGRFLATGGTDNNVRVWEIGGESLSPHLLRGHTGPVNAVSFTADGEGLFSGSNDGSARLWDPESGKELLALDSRGESGSSRTMESHTQPVSEVAFGLVTRLIALASAGAPTQPWNITGGSVALPHDIQHSAVRAVAVGAERQLVMADANGAIRLGAGDAEQPIADFIGHEGSVNDVDIDVVGRRLATAGNDGTARIWDMDTGEQLYQLGGDTTPRTPLNAVAFSPDGRSLVAVGSNRPAVVWDVASTTANGDEELTLRSDTEILGVAYGEDGLIALAAADGSVTVLNSDEASTDWLDLFHGGTVNDVVFSPDDKQLASAGINGMVRIWEVASGEMLHEWRSHPAAVKDVVYAPNGEDRNQNLATAGTDGTARIWSAKSGALQRTLQASKAALLAIAYDSEGRRLATAGADGMAIIWDTLTGVEELAISAHISAGIASNVSDVAFSADGRYLATASDDTTAKIWDASTGELQHILAGHAAAVTGAIFYETGQHERLITASADGKLRFWDPERGKLLLMLDRTRVPIRKIELNSEGERVATVGEDKTVRIILLDRHELVRLAAERLEYAQPIIDDECMQYLDKSPCPTRAALDGVSE